MHPLYLIHEIEIALIEMMNPHIPILSTAGVASPLRVNSDGIKRPKMSLDSTNLIFEDLVVEPRFKLSLPGGGRCDIHGSLASSEYDEVLFGGYCSGVQGCVGDVAFEQLEIPGRYKLGPSAIISG
jgi:hypothetical protein